VVTAFRHSQGCWQLEQTGAAVLLCKCMRGRVVKSDCRALCTGLGKAETAKRELKQIISITCLFHLCVTQDLKPTNKYIMNKEAYCEP